MKRKSIVLVMAFIGVIAANQIQAQVNPIVINQTLRNQYIQYQEDIKSAKSTIDDLNCQIESIYKKYPGQDNYADIKIAIDPIKDQISEIEKRRDVALKAIVPVEDSIKKIIKDAKGIPVVWRSFSFVGMGRNVSTEKYIIENGNIVIEYHSDPLENCEKH